MERDVGPVEGDQQFGLVGVQPGKRAVEGREAGLAPEDTIEAGLEAGLGAWGGIAAIGLEVGVEPPQVCSAWASACPQCAKWPANRVSDRKMTR